MTFFKPALATLAAASLAACATAPALTPANANFNDLRAEYPNLTAVEFSILDANNDGMVDAQERMAIGSDDQDGLNVSES